MGISCGRPVRKFCPLTTAATYATPQQTAVRSRLTVAELLLKKDSLRPFPLFNGWQPFAILGNAMLVYSSETETLKPLMSLRCSH